MVATFSGSFRIVALSSVMPSGASEADTDGASSVAAASNRRPNAVREAVALPQRSIFDVITTLRQRMTYPWVSASAQTASANLTANW